MQEENKRVKLDKDKVIQLQIYHEQITELRFDMQPYISALQALQKIEQRLQSACTKLVQDKIETGKLYDIDFATGDLVILNGATSSPATELQTSTKAKSVTRV